MLVLRCPAVARLTPRLTDRLEELPNRDEQFDAVTAANATRNAVIRSWIMAQVNPALTLPSKTTRCSCVAVRPLLPAQLGGARLVIGNVFCVRGPG